MKWKVSNRSIYSAQGKQVEVSGKGIYADITIHGYPSCCGVVILSNLDYNEISSAKILLDKILARAYSANFTVAESITAEYQIEVIKTLKASGFYKHGSSVESRRTGNALTAWRKKLVYGEEPLGPHFILK